MSKAKIVPKSDRKTKLLQVCLLMLEDQRDSHYVTNLFDGEQTVNYDGVDCDGLCLIDDIKAAL